MKTMGLPQPLKHFSFVARDSYGARLCPQDRPQHVASSGPPGLAALLRPVFGKAAWCLCTMVFASGAFAQSSASNTVPVVTIVATDPGATWAGDPGVFTVFRSGNPAPALNIYCCISGTASNGVDYQSISSFVALGSGVLSNTVVIKPINRGQTNAENVVLDLCPSPLMNPVNYSIGSPSEATVYISPGVTSNLPPTVAIVNPTNGAVYPAPANISLIARASDPDGNVTNLEFFANGTDLGRGLMVVLDPPGVNGVTGPVYFLSWTNILAGIYSLTAIATGNGGASTTSKPVNITVGSTSNAPPIVRITSPPNGAVYRAPVFIPIYAYAASPNGPITSVQFFANSNSIGFGQHVIAVPPPLSPGPIQPPILIVEPSNYWALVWTNPPISTNIFLTAEASNSNGVSSVSAAVQISVLPPLPPPTNRPAIVSIVATDPIAIEGTNCWPWLSLASAVPTWSNWVSPTAVFKFQTNCGPKNATFTVYRKGATNDSLDVNYVIGGTSTNGVDYVTLSGDVVIASGQHQASIPIIPLDDGPPDINSTVVLKLAPGTNYVVGQPAGAAAIILDSPGPRAASGIAPGHLFHLASTGPNGAWFHVEYSTDLSNWQPLCTNQVINGSVDFIDPDASSQPGRFYRTVPEAVMPAQ